MPHAEVSGVEPAAPESLLSSLRIVEVARHHIVPAHHNFTHGGAVAWDVGHIFRHHSFPVGYEHPDALMRHHSIARLRVQPCPTLLDLADRIRTPGLGKTVVLLRLRALERPDDPQAPAPYGPLHLEPIEAAANFR